MSPDTAVAVREEQHPIIQKIDAKMPEIAEMLPPGMDADRFRRVVVQALVRNPELWECTPVSVVSAIVESAQLGLEPTGVLGRAWLLPYRNKGQKEAKLIPGYRGYAELAWRADKIILKAVDVRAGDTFSYSDGIGADHFLRHVANIDDPERETDDANITFVFAKYTLADGRQDFTVMSRKAVEKIRARARYDNPVWTSDFGEMAKKTVLRRLLKITPLSPEVQNVLGRDEEIDFDTPVARVADERVEATRSRITERTNALRAGQPAPTSGDPWMRETHALGKMRGLDHDKLHDYAVRRFGVESMKDLTPSQRADLTEAVEKQPIVESPGSVPATVALDSATSPAPEPQPEREQIGSPATATTAAEPASGELDASPEVPNGAESEAGSLLDQVLEATGGHLVPEKPPRPGTDQYKALEATGPDGKAAARAYWQRKEPAGARETAEAAEVPIGL